LDPFLFIKMCSIKQFLLDIYISINMVKINRYRLYLIIGVFFLYNTILNSQSNVYILGESNYSSECSGVLYDSGGKDANYKDNEDYIFTICPDEGNSINFSFEYYNLLLINQGEFEYDTLPNYNELEGDRLTVHNGVDTAYSHLFEINGNALNYEVEGLIFGGGVKFGGCTNSDCITLHFVSDESINAEGFVFTWDCVEEYCQVKTMPDITVRIESDKDTIAKYILSEGVNGKVVKIECDDRAIGVFSNISDDIGLKKGLLLTSGIVENALGPNNLRNKSFILNSGGDDDLDSLSAIENPENWKLSLDACVVEMDVLALSDEISYKYVFGSDEYDEFANNDYNDIFALLISGKGIHGDPRVRNQKNMAIIPGTNDFVSINSVNASKNWQYYHSNLYGRDLEYDGLVWDSLGRNNYLIAKQKVVPCETYHLKFAIADRNDTIYDSGVFIGELTDGRPEFSLEVSKGFDNLIDNCDLVDGVLSITLPKVSEEEQYFYVEVSGDAKRNEDYTVDIPNEIVFHTGEIRKEFKVKVVLDDIEEGEEHVIIKFFKQLSCGRKQVGELMFSIEDNIDIDINGGLDTLIRCENEEIQLKASGAKFYHWEPANLVDNPDSAIINYSNDKDAWVKVRGRLIDTAYNKCYGEDSVFISNLYFEIIKDSSLTVCENELVYIAANKKLQGIDKKWYIGERLISELDSVRFIVGENDIELYVDVFFDNCLISDTISINVVNHPELSLFSEPDGPYYIGDTIIVGADVILNSWDSLKWTTNDSVFYDNANSEYQFELKQKDNIIIVEVFNEFGCNTVDSLSIIADIRKLMFPNLIFPDDKENSIFSFYKMYSGLEILKFQVFDRWGTKVFDCDNRECAEKGWDASFENKRVPPGVYLFVCNVKVPNGPPQKYFGQISVIY